MTEERRGAARIKIPPGVEAVVSGVPVTIVDLSSIGARIQHEERFTLSDPQLRLKWEGKTATIAVRVARSTIVGRRESRLTYESGVSFMSVDSPANSMVASILRWAAGEPVPEEAPAEEAPPPATPQPPREERSLDDSWIRQVRFLKDDLDESLPYAQFRLIGGHWEKEYVASPTQPPDGFTIARDDTAFHELQKTFEYADPDTRRMIQIALETKLTGA